MQDQVVEAAGEEVVGAVAKRCGAVSKLERSRNKAGSVGWVGFGYELCEFSSK
jgi:hypothetical protein